MIHVDERIAALQSYLKEQGLSSLYISGTDVHLGEYVPERYRIRQWITGFTGSAGTVIVTTDACHLWVDSRYYIQGEVQTKGTSVTLHLLGVEGVLDPFEWVGEQQLTTLAVDGSTISVDDYRTLKKNLAGSRTALTIISDIFDELWPDRPDRPFSMLKELPDEIAGRSRGEKLAQLRSAIKKLKASSIVISTLDDIAWVLNLRGRDLPYTPVFYAYLVITEARVVLFTDRERFDEDLYTLVSRDIDLFSYESFYKELSDLIAPSPVVVVSTSQTTQELFARLQEEAKVLEQKIQISTFLKARKNATEIEGFRRAHYLDGIALVRLLSSLDNNQEPLDEISIADRLESFRKESDEYLFPSFSPIAGFAAHGAMEHYSASEESSAKLIENSLLVLDTGGQYLTGTTDVTRTLLFGEASDEMKRDYTLVLKGNLALSRARFPRGTKGYQLDVLARQFLWNRGYAYTHGTGHGVGFCLGVHEGPMRISPHPIDLPLEPGNVLSNEPGLYRRGSYGIRLENLVSVFEEGVSEFGPFYTFEVLTLCPFERRLIDLSLLTDEEVAMLDAYHQWVYDELSRSLEEPDEQWLKQATLPLKK
ncbi:MAG: aminopeptidase P family protein [Sphaerochaetaceae bacterium]|nr:aminopeptidase P family protein [Sphaerochaetaceae bacterium]